MASTSDTGVSGGSMHSLRPRLEFVSLLCLGIVSVMMERWSRWVNLSILLPSNKCKYEGSCKHDILWTITNNDKKF